MVWIYSSFIKDLILESMKIKDYIKNIVFIQYANSNLVNHTKKDTRVGMRIILALWVQWDVNGGP